MSPPAKPAVLEVEYILPVYLANRNSLVSQFVVLPASPTQRTCFRENLKRVGPALRCKERLAGAAVTWLLTAVLERASGAEQHWAGVWLFRTS